LYVKDFERLVNYDGLILISVRCWTCRCSLAYSIN